MLPVVCMCHLASALEDIGVDSLRGSVQMQAIDALLQRRQAAKDDEERHLYRHHRLQRRRRELMAQLRRALHL